MSAVLPGFGAIYKRELKGFGHSASTYVALGLFFLIAGAVYHDLIVIFVKDSAAASNPISDGPPNITVAVIQQTFQMLAGLILFTIPILSMRLISAERSSGTFEVLLTCPVTDWSILLGKYFALVTVGGMLVALTGIYPLATYMLGQIQGAIPDPRVIISCHVGLLLIFATYAAFGLMASSFTQSQVTASILTLVGLIIWNAIAEFQIPGELFKHVAHELSASRHTENFTLGFFKLRDLLFYGLSSFICLFIAARSLESRRWRL